LSPEELKVFSKKMESQKAMFSGGLGVFFTFLVMTLTVYLVGVITTVFLE